MLKTVDIVKEEEFPIARRQSVHGVLNGYAVDYACLHPIANPKIPRNIFLPGVRQHLIE